jgi:hypothetical protein
MFLRVPLRAILWRCILTNESPSSGVCCRMKARLDVVKMLQMIYIINGLSLVNLSFLGGSCQVVPNPHGI